MTRPIDLRSDTVTKPTPAMRAAMAAAEVGDDVIDVDPTIRALEEKLADMLGKEASVFMPSGTMTNQIAVRLHCRPGDEFLCEEDCHIFNYEQAAYAQLSGVAARPVKGQHGVLEVSDVAQLIRSDDDHLARTTMLTIENTHNRGAGKVQPLASVVEICSWAHQKRLSTHLDGARLFNAVVASGIAANQWAEHFDTVSVCMSKGLGAPVGSLLAGSQAAMKAARRHRKLFGGGMRQAGIIAAGALFALEHHIERLAEDHAAARAFADILRDAPNVQIEPETVETNMVIFRVGEQLGTAAEFTEKIKAHGVLVLPFGPQHIRAVTHLDVSSDEVQRAAEVIAELANEG